MNQGNWEQLILSYLKEKGYKEAEQALERTLRAQDPDMSLTDRLAINKGVVEQLLSNLITGDSAQAFIDALDRFASWLDNSLDQYRSELSKVLYPAFVHTYLTLVSKEAPQAGSLMNKYQRRFTEVEGSLSRSRAAELKELSGVVLKQHMTTSTLARQLLSRKQSVKLTSYAHDLLMHFLHSAPGMLCLTSLINKHVTLEVVESPEVDADQVGQDAAGEGGGGADGAGPEALVINSQPVNLGLLKGNIDDRYAEMKEEKLQEAQAAGGGASAAAGGADGGGGGGDGAAATPAAKKPKKDGKAAVADAGSGGPTVKRLHPGERVEPQAWTPQLSDAVVQAGLKDVEVRVDVSASLRPSCCFFTFANTKQTMNCASFTSSSNMVAAGFADSSVRLYDLQKLATANTASAANPGRSTPPPPGAGSSSKHNTSADGTSQMELDDVEPGSPGMSMLYGHTGPVHAVDFTHDSRMLFSASGDGTVRLWSADLATALTSFKGHLMPVWDVRSGPFGYHFVSGGADKTARVWATDSVRMLRILAGHQADVDVVRWHPNCHYVTTASSDMTVRLWDIASGRCVRLMGKLQAAPTCMAVHPDGRHVAVGCERGTVAVWDLGSGRRLSNFKAHLGPVWSLAYSQGQGSLLATGGSDETVRVWSIAGVGPADAPDAAAAAPAKAPVPHSKHKQIIASHTKSSSVTHLQFSNRNLLLAAGAFHLRTRGGRVGGEGGVAGGRKQVAWSRDVR